MVFQNRYRLRNVTCDTKFILFLVQSEYVTPGIYALGPKHIDLHDSMGFSIMALHRKIQNTEKYPDAVFFDNFYENPEANCLQLVF